MRFRDAAILIALMHGATPVRAQEIDFRFQVGAYTPLRMIADAVPEGEGARSIEHESSFQGAASLLLWWTNAIGASLSLSAADHAIHSWRVTNGVRDLNVQESVLHTQVEGRAVLRAVKHRGFAMDASAGIAYVNLGGNVLELPDDRNAWGGVVGADASQRLSTRASAVLGLSLTRYDFPGRDMRQLDVRSNLGIQVRIFPWPE